MSKPPRTILLTGYEPFNGMDDNPSSQLARQLANYQPAPGWKVISTVLPVAFTAMPATLCQQLEELQPAIVIGMGLAYGSAGIRLEQQAKNSLHYTQPDNGGATYHETQLAANGLPDYSATLPLEAIVDQLLKAGIPASLSGDAGSHLCNAMLYYTLQWATRKEEVSGIVTPVGFIHLPAVPQLVASVLRNKPGSEPALSMSLSLMLKGVKLALKWSATANKRPGNS